MGRASITEVDIESLLTGSPVLDESLAPLAGLFASLRSGNGAALGEGAIARIAATAAQTSQDARQPMPPARTTMVPLGALRGRAAAFATTVIVVIGGTTGLAVAADGAKPGDVLYGADRALEAIGIGAGDEQERWSEVEALVDAGKLRRGLHHAAAVLDGQQGNSAASRALLEAADRVDSAGSAPSAATQTSVAGLLTYIAENSGEIDGTRVAEMAAEIGGPPGDATNPEPKPSDSTGPPEGTPADPPGLDGREPGPPDNSPADPPGLDGREPGPPDDVPADPPGHSDSKPGPPDKDR